MTRTPFPLPLLAILLLAWTVVRCDPASAATLVVEGADGRDVVVQYSQLPPDLATEACAGALGPDAPPAEGCAYKLNGWSSPCIVILPKPVSVGVLIHEFVYRCAEGRFRY